MLRTDGDPELLDFDAVTRFLHWLTLFLVATIFVLAFSIDFASSKEEAVALIQLHRSFGVTVWAVTLGRLVWRQFAQFPNWPADMPQAMRFAAIGGLAASDSTTLESGYGSVARRYLYAALRSSGRSRTTGTNNVSSKRTQQKQLPI